MKLAECYLSSMYNAVGCVYSPINNSIGVINMLVIQDNIHHIKSIFEENHCTVQRIFWVSKFDYTEYTEEEPKIIDAYDCFIQVRGLKHNIEFSKYVIERNK